MQSNKFPIEYYDLSKNTYYISNLTQNAKPNSEYEVSTHFDEVEIYYFIEGDLYFAFEGKHYEINNETLVIIANGTMHRPIIKKECRYFRKRILLSKDAFLKLCNIELYTNIADKKIMIFDDTYTRKFNVGKTFSYIEEFLSYGTSYNDFCALISIFNLLIMAERNFKDYSISSHKSNNKIAKIIQYIDEHISENICYKNISKEFYISEANLYRYFKKQTGFTLGEYISERKMLKAQSILNAGGSANDAAIASGFNDYSSFYRNFVKKIKMTPLEYIRKIKNN